MTTPVFLYGSNLNLDDLNHWAESRCGTQVRLTPLQRVWLPDHRLSFGYHSQSRRGGALDVVPDIGHAVPGLLCLADDAALAVLDRKEGHPRFYRRTSVVVQTEEGRVVPALTWTVVPTRRVPHVSPTADYREIVLEGYRRWGLPEKVVWSAVECSGRNAVEGLFVYGTVRTGHSRANLLPGLRCLFRIEQGSLRDHGEYPALMLEGHDATTGAVGELVREVPGEVLQELDRVEGFDGWGAGGLFVRRLLFGERVQPLWTYVWNGQMMGPRNPEWVGVSDPVVGLFWREAQSLGRGLLASSTHRRPVSTWRERWWSEGLMIADRRPATPQVTATVVTPHARALADLVERLVESLGDAADVERAVLEGMARYQAEQPDEEHEDEVLEAVLRELIAGVGYGRGGCGYEP